jgi:hypothetical protein
MTAAHHPNLEGFSSVKTSPKEMKQANWPCKSTTDAQLSALPSIEVVMSKEGRFPASLCVRQRQLSRGRSRCYKDELRNVCLPPPEG